MGAGICGALAVAALFAMASPRPAEAAPFAYVANSGSNTVSVIDTATNPPMVVTTVPVGIAPIALAITPDGKHAYVANTNSKTVSVIDTASNAVVATVPVGRGLLGIAITPDGTHAYVTNNNDNNISVIETATNTVVATIATNYGTPWGIAVTPDGKQA